MAFEAITGGVTRSLSSLDTSMQFELFGYKFLHPTAFLFLILVLLIVFIVIYKNTRVLKDEFRKHPLLRRKVLRNRTLLALSRSLMFICIFIALATPYTQEIREVQGNPRITLLVDNSASMELFDTGFVDTLTNELGKHIPTSSKIIAQDLYSEIGDAMLEHLKSDENIMMITDGNTNYREYGASIADVALFATQINASVGAIKIDSLKQDAAISVIGPETVTAGIDAFYNIFVYKTQSAEYKIQLELDGEVIPKEQITILKQTDHVDMYELKLVVEKGEHLLKVQVINKDSNEINNVFYKAIEGVKKQDILLITKKSDPLITALRDQYAVTAIQNLPNTIEELDDYYAIIVNDVPAKDLDAKLLEAYIDKGNGVLFVGGYNSFDRGGYKKNSLEQLLPVQVGKGTVSRGASSIMLALDISGSLGHSTTLDMENQEFIQNFDEDLSTSKALALSVLESLNVKNTVGAITSVWTGREGPQNIMIDEISPLYQKREVLADKISRLQPRGQLRLSSLLEGSAKALEHASGAKNILLFTDGQIFAADDVTRSLELANQLRKRNIKIYPVVIETAGTNKQLFLDIAEITGGIYFSASQQNRLTVLFGDPEEIPLGESFQVFVLDQNHFITNGLDTDATMTAYNQVVPKQRARVLATTTSGLPALTVQVNTISEDGYQGKTAALNVFDGNNLGKMLEIPHSKILTRTINWLIGDPQRKETYRIMVEDSRINEPVKVIVRADAAPVVEGMTFSKTGLREYSTYLDPQSIGAQEILGKQYAVNYPREYQIVGIDPAFIETITSTGGEIFNHDDTDVIVDYIKRVSKRQKVSIYEVQGPFILLALGFLMLEIIIRRLAAFKRQKN